MNTQFAPNSMSLPPPARPDLDLLDGNRFVGWVRGWAVVFRGFANESEAAGAAWVTYRALARRLAHRHGGPPAPTGVEPLALSHAGDPVAILAGGQPIATLVRPGVESLSGPDSFGFEIQVPVPADELFMRSLAYRIYRTLRKSGARWAMWENRRATARRVAPRRQAPWVPTPGPVENSPAAIVFISKFLFAAIAIVLGAALIAAAPRTVTIPIGVVLATGLVAAGLVAMVGRWRPTPNKRSARRSAVAAPHPADRTDGIRLRDDDPSDESMRDRGWLALGVVSITVLLLALVVPKELAVAFVAIGLAGLLVFRLTATWVGWVPDRGIRGESHSRPSAPRQEPTTEGFRSRSNGARPMSPQRMAGDEQHGTSPRLLSS